MVIRGTPFVSNRKRNRTDPGKFQGVFPGSLQGVFLRDVQGVPKQTEPSRLSCFEATPAVIIACPILMLSPPPRPPTNQRRMRGGRPDQTSQQMTDF